MLDGFDEVPERKRPPVSQWISAQMREYPECVFIVTPRPAGFKDYVAQRPRVPLFVNRFTPQQQEDFIRRWYVCQERCARGEGRRQVQRAKEVAEKRAADLITQLRQGREDLGEMAENPLLLTMLTTFHRFAAEQKLPVQRLELYRGICHLQLVERPRARSIAMLLSFEHSQGLLQQVALALTKAQRLKIGRQALLAFLAKQPFWQEQEVEPADWLRQMLEVSELLVEREPGEYEFPHLSFQGYFAATRLAQAQNSQARQANELVLQNWTGAVWRETVLLYTAQLSPRALDWVIRQACQQGSEAAALADLCLKEYPRPEKIAADLEPLMLRLKGLAQASKYQQLETYLKNGQWREADQETYRLMITEVGKEEGQWFDRKDLLNFPCEPLRAIDGLWVQYSNGRFGFSVQKNIYLSKEIGGIADGRYHEEAWTKFCHAVGWQRDGSYVSYSRLIFNTSAPQGHLPVLSRWRGDGWGWMLGGLSLWVGDVSSLASRLVKCNL